MSPLRLTQAQEAVVLSPPFHRWQDFDASPKVTLAYDDVSLETQPQGDAGNEGSPW